MPYPIVDYFSFTVPIPSLISQWEVADRLEMGNLFDERTSALLELFASQLNWRESRISGRFPRMIQFHDIGLIYMEGDKSDVSLIQLSGKGCEWARNQGVLENFLTDWQDRTTRIDIAVDIISDSDPELFARMLGNKRFKTDSHEKSLTGTTWYVGSYKSDRFCRVYRYSDTERRRGTLRIEYQFGNGQAKHCVTECLSKGVFTTAVELGNLYQWKHQDYFLSKDDAKFKSAPRPQVRVGKERWIYEQVLPSLIKEAANGNLDLLVDLKDKLCGIIDEYISFNGG